MCATASAHSAIAGAPRDVVSTMYPVVSRQLMLAGNRPTEGRAVAL